MLSRCLDEFDKIWMYEQVIGEEEEEALLVLLEQDISET
jgi:hypothetical protein